MTNTKTSALTELSAAQVADVDWFEVVDSSLSTTKKVSAGQVSTYDHKLQHPEEFCIACSDETTAIDSTGEKVSFRMPFGLTVTSVKASLNSACSTGTLTIDINETGASILSTKLTIDATELTSTTAASAFVLSDTEVGDDAEVTIDVDNTGDDTATGLKVWIFGYRTVSQAFDPDTIAGLTLWMDATAADTLTLSGSDVTEWADRKNGYTFSPDGTSPSSGTRTLNGRNVIDFDGVDDDMTADTTLLLNNATDGSWTAFAVFDSDSTNDCGYVDADNLSSRLAQVLRQQSTASSTIGFNGGSPTEDTGSTVTTGAHCMMSVNTGSTIEVFWDGTGNGSTAIAGQNKTACPWAIGSAYAGAGTIASRMNGGLAEVLIWSRDLTSDEIALVEAYINTKWGITFS